MRALNRARVFLAQKQEFVGACRGRRIEARHCAGFVASEAEPTRGDGPALNCGTGNLGQWCARVPEARDSQRPIKLHHLWPRRNQEGSGATPRHSRLGWNTAGQRNRQTHTDASQQPQPTPASACPPGHGHQGYPAGGGKTPAAHDVVTSGASPQARAAGVRTPQQREEGVGGDGFDAHARARGAQGAGVQR